MRSERRRPRRGLDERSLRRPTDRRRGLRAVGRPEPDQSLRCEQAGRRARGHGGVRGHRRPAAGHRPHGVALRARQARLPGEDPRRRRAAAAGGERVRAVWRRMGFAHLHRRRRRCHRGPARRRRDRRHPPPGERGSRLAGRLGAAPVRRGADRRRDRGRPRVDLGRASTPPAWGVLAPTPCRPASRCGAGRTRSPTTSRSCSRQRANAT